METVEQNTTEKNEIEFEHSTEIGEIAASLAKAQSVIKQPNKNRIAKIFSPKGSYEYNYADLPDVLEACIPHLSANGIALIQSPFTGRDYVSVTTMLIHTSGQWFKSKLTMGIADTRPQTVGSAITYARRYSVGPLVGVAPDDDDDGAVSSNLEPAADHGKKNVKQEAVKKSTGSPKIYKGTEADKRELMPMMARAKIPEELWKDVSHEMIDKSFAHLATLIPRYAP